MTETPTPATLPCAESAAEALSGDSGTSVLDERENGSQKANKEARYRVERNEARAERDALAQRIERMQRAEVERLAAEHLAAPADFWLSDNEVSAYLTEDGEVDAELVAEDARLLISERPRLGKRSPAFDPTQGHGGNGQPKREPSWGALLGD